VVAVSPLVRGEVVKGPTAAFMEHAGLTMSSAGIALAYRDLLDGLVADQRTGELPVLETDVLMDSADTRERLAANALQFALALG
jgi:LPPG:FO 2-phospho-L-lactate transferase